MKTTTKKDFEIYKSEVLRWIEVFGLKDWAVYFKREKIEGCSAQVETDTRGRCATFFLSTKVTELWDGPEESALHETAHLLIADLADMANNGEASWLVDRTDEIFVTRFVNGINQIIKKG